MRFYDIIDIFDEYNRPWTIRINAIFSTKFKEEKKDAMKFYLLVFMWAAIFFRFCVRLLRYHRVPFVDTLLPFIYLYGFSISVSFVIAVVPFCIIYYFDARGGDVTVGYTYEQILLLPHHISKNYKPTDIIDDCIFIENGFNTFLTA